MANVVIIGAGPAGLSAARELLGKGVPATVLEADPRQVGGISRTGIFEGFRYDIGGHRFFSKNEEIVQLWKDLLGDDLLVVQRKSRIYYRQRYFDYPLRPWKALASLGLGETLACIGSYVQARLRPRRPVLTFEDWVVNAVGARLYRTFFQSYTEKVWGTPCTAISADWAAQRIQGLSMLGAVLHALGWKRGTPKTLTERFYYPRFGPGMLWEKIAGQLGSNLKLAHAAERIEHRDGRATAVHAGGKRWPVEHLISSMPLRTLFRSLDPPPPAAVLQAAERIRYRDFLTVVLIVRDCATFPDQWIYIHDPAVRVGRIQNFTNWSPWMVPPGSRTGLGMEYFCFESDSLWSLPDEEIVELAKRELAMIGLAAQTQVDGGVVVRVPKAYPVYDRDYQDALGSLRAYLEENLRNVQVVGRNGMHRYNNQDHAMMTGILAARQLLGEGSYDLWKVNGDAEYLEQDAGSGAGFRLTPQPL